MSSWRKRWLKPARLPHASTTQPSLRRGSGDLNAHALWFARWLLPALVSLTAAVTLPLMTAEGQEPPLPSHEFFGGAPTLDNRAVADGTIVLALNEAGEVVGSGSVTSQLWAIAVLPADASMVRFQINDVEPSEPFTVVSGEVTRVSLAFVSIPTSADTGGPRLQSASVSGSRLLLTYNEALNGASVPARSDFAVTVNGSVLLVTAVRVVVQTVVLDLLRPVQAGDTITVSYTAGASPIEDLAGNTAVNLAAKPVALKAAAATVVAVTSSANNIFYGPGAVLDITILFSETTRVIGTPQLALETGRTDRDAVFSSGTGSRALVFRYTVQPGDTSADLDYVASTALRLNGGTIRDAAGNDADLRLAGPGTTGSLGVNKNLIIDTTPPSLRSVAVDAARLLLTFDEQLSPISVPAIDDFEVLSNGSIPVAVSNVRVAGAIVELTLAAAVAEGDTVTVRYRAGARPIADFAGNAASDLVDQPVGDVIEMDAVGMDTTPDAGMEMGPDNGVDVGPANGVDVGPDDGEETAPVRFPNTGSGGVVGTTDGGSTPHPAILALAALLVGGGAFYGTRRLWR